MQHISSNTADEVKAVWLQHTWNAVGHTFLSVEPHEWCNSPKKHRDK